MKPNDQKPKWWSGLDNVNKNKRIYFVGTNTTDAYTYRHYIPEGRVRYKCPDDDLTQWQLRLKRIQEDAV